ncbi:MAG TPA: phage holin family protein [Candidatus Dormibacteraeota bacterium]
MAKHNYPDSTADLAADIVESTQQLVRLEIALAKQEVKELALRNGVAIGLFAGAGLFAMLALLVVLPVLIVVLVPAHWVAALVWLVLYLGGAVAMGLVGKSMLRIEAPQRTITTLKETKEWALRQLSTSSK